MADGYLGSADHGPSLLQLANPLVMLESEHAPERPLPPFFAPVGTSDPLLDDTRRLKAALDRRGVHCEARYYVREMPPFTRWCSVPARVAVWQHSFEFLERHCGGDGPAEGG